MIKLETNKNQLEADLASLKKLQWKWHGGSKGISIDYVRKGIALSSDALHAHTLQERIDKVLAIKPENAFRSTVPANQYLAMGSNEKLVEIQAILGGENNETHS